LSGAKGGTENVHASRLFLYGWLPFRDSVSGHVESLSRGIILKKNLKKIAEKFRKNLNTNVPKKTEKSVLACGGEARRA